MTGLAMHARMLAVGLVSAWVMDFDGTLCNPAAW
jgi:hypothetical protein